MASKDGAIDSSYATNGDSHSTNGDTGAINGHNDAAFAEARSKAQKVAIPEANLKEELKETFYSVEKLIVPEKDPFRAYRGKSILKKVGLFIVGLFPILDWLPKYKKEYLFGDIVGGLTITSLAVPQDLAYAKLAHLDPINGLYTSFPVPLVYAAMGTARHLAIGPVAVLSLVFGDLLINYYDPKKQKKQYYNLAITATFFTGVWTLLLGVLRLGWIIDYLSHPATVGFMGGAALTIFCSQLKGLLGLTNFTNNTDIVSVGNAIADNADEFNSTSFAIGISFFIYLTIIKCLLWYFKKTPTVGKVLFYVNALGPLTCCIIATLSVFLSDVYKTKKVKIVGNIPKGVNPSSLSNFEWTGEDLTNAMAVGIVTALIGLTEASAIGRTFAALKGYHLDGNQEMIALGTMNIVGSFTSCYVATGSFSRSAVNYAAGTETLVANIVMAIVILLTLLFITPLFKYVPNAALSAIIMNAVITLVDLPSAWKIVKTDKFDTLIMLGAFFGTLFVSIEIGLLIAVSISFLKIVLYTTRPHLNRLNLLTASTEYRIASDYPSADNQDGILVYALDTVFYFPSANFIRERVLELATHYTEDVAPVTNVILDFSSVPDVDTTTIHALEELYKQLEKKDIQLAIVNPSKLTLRKFAVDGFLETLGEEWLFLTVNEAVSTIRLSKGFATKEV